MMFDVCRPVFVVCCVICVGCCVLIGSCCLHGWLVVVGLLLVRCVGAWWCCFLFAAGWCRWLWLLSVDVAGCVLLLLLVG